VFPGKFLVPFLCGNSRDLKKRKGSQNKTRLEMEQDADEMNVPQGNQQMTTETSSSSSVSSFVSNVLRPVRRHNFTGVKNDLLYIVEEYGIGISDQQKGCFSSFIQALQCLQTLAFNYRKSLKDTGLKTPANLETITRPSDMSYRWNYGQYNLAIVIHKLYAISEDQQRQLSQMFPSQKL
jgi:hypothetical protein